MSILKRLARITLGLSAFVLLGWSMWQAGRYVIDSRWYRTALPEQIGVTTLIGSGSDLSLAVALLPIRHEACGGAVFRLTDETLAALESDGLAYLKDARTGRGDAASPQEHHFTYEPWQLTPVPPNWVSEGSWPGMHCLRWLVGTSVREIIAAAKEPGSFFSTKHESWIALIPKLRIVVFTYYG